MRVKNYCGAARRGTLYQLLGAGSGHLLQPYVLSFLPGEGYTSDPIGHAGEEFAYVIVGAVDVLLSEEVHRLRQGDAIRFRTETLTLSGTRHLLVSPWSLGPLLLHGDARVAPRRQVLPLHGRS